MWTYFWVAAQKIRHKPNCPTKDKIGWSPKWGKPREVYLSDTAIKILDMIPKRESFGLVKVKEVGRNKNGTKKYLKRKIPADFVFTIKDHKTGGYRRVDDIKRSWNSLLKTAKVGDLGFDKFILHDLRRYRNLVNECVYNMNVRQRSQQLGNSERVNATHYSGMAGSELLKIKAQMHELAARNLELQAKVKLLEDTN